MTISRNPAHGPARTAETLADEYARSRKSRLMPVSMSSAIRAMRTVLPNSTYTDKELASIIAARVVHYGHTIDFDSQNR